MKIEIFVYSKPKWKLKQSEKCEPFSHITLLCNMDLYFPICAFLNASKYLIRSLLKIKPLIKTGVPLHSASEMFCCLVIIIEYFLE